MQVRIILEVMGRPAEHVGEALRLLVDKIEKEQKVIFLEKKLHAPAPIEKVKDLFTAFADLTLELETLEQYLHLLFSYMPSHAEIIYPESLTLSNAEWNALSGLLLQKLHTYETVTKKAVVERDLMFRKIQEKAPELLKDETRRITAVVPEKPVKRAGKKSGKKENNKKK